MTSFCDQRGVALDVELRLDGVGLGLRDAGLGGLHAASAPVPRRQPCPWTSEPVVLTVVLTLTLVIGTLTVAWMCCGLRAGEVRLRLLEGDLVVAGVDLGDGVAGLYLSGCPRRRP